MRTFKYLFGLLGVSLTKKGSVMIVVSIIVSIVLIGGAVTTIILSTRDNSPGNGAVLEPDYEHVKPDDNAQTIPGETTGESEDVPQGGGSMNLVYSDQVVVDLTSKKLGLYYQNPSSSSHSIVVQIIIERGENQYLVAESGGINPGYMLTELPLSESVQLTSGVYKGIMKLWFFDPDTGDRALVDTNIPVNITVK